MSIRSLKMPVTASLIPDPNAATASATRTSRRAYSLVVTPRSSSRKQVTRLRKDKMVPPDLVVDSRPELQRGRTNGSRIRRELNP